MKAALKARIAIKRTILKGLERNREKNLKLIRSTMTEIAKLEDEYNSPSENHFKSCSAAEYRSRD